MSRVANLSLWIHTKVRIVRDPSWLVAQASDSEGFVFAFTQGSKGLTAVRVPPKALHLLLGVTFLIVAVAPVAAAPNGTASGTATQVGTIYCGTGVETGIDIVFSALAGLGLPATGIYTGVAGLKYMRAGGNPEKKNKAKEGLVRAGMGFAIVVLALISPELVDKVGSQMGFSFSNCVKPF